MLLHSLLLSWMVALSPSQTGTPGGPVFINERTVSIPIRWERPELTHLIQQMQLFVSSDEGKQWHLYASVEPTQKEVSFVAPADGVYWFDLITIFKDGQTKPQAPGLQPPLIVVVDTRAPRVTLRPLQCGAGQAGVAWEIDDEHLDLRSFKLEYRDPGTGSWVSLPVIPPVAKGEKRWPLSSQGPVLVRMTVADFAENSTQAQVEVPVSSGPAPEQTVSGPRLEPNTSLASVSGSGQANSALPPNSSAVTPAGPVSATNPTVSNSNRPAVVPPPPPPVSPPTPGHSHSTPPPPPSLGQLERQLNSEVSQNPPGLPPTSPAWPGSNPPTVRPSATSPPAPLPTETTSPRVIARSDSSGLPTSYASWNHQSPAPSNPNGSIRGRSNLAPLRYLNSTRANLHYEIARVGPSGLGSVEVWMTRDDGRTWFKAADDPDLQPPVQVEFPGEGVYGLTLLVRSRAGLGRQPPQPGEPPDLRVEVDLTPPYAELYNVEADPLRRDSLILLWSATDKNLAANPITLKWAERDSGPWHVIAADVPNTGRYVWKMPDQLPFMVYLRLEVRDLAGNLAVAQTPKPVLVDLQEPEVKLLDITPPNENR